MVLLTNDINVYAVTNKYLNVSNYKFKINLIFQNMVNMLICILIVFL